MSVFRRGNKSPEVLELKTKFNKIGFSLPLTNEFDLELDVAVRILQREKKLVIDGIVGPMTLKALGSVLSLSSNLTAKNGISFLHEVEYQTQKDNKYNPGGTCGPTSMSMAMSFYGAKSIVEKQLEDDIFRILQTAEAQAEFKKTYTWAVGKYNPHNIHGMLQWVCNKYFSPVKDKFLSNQKWEDLRIALLQGPIVVSGHFTGNGHVICLIGETATGDIIANDPYGNWGLGYSKKLSGERVVYRKEDLQRILKPGKNLYHLHKFTK